MVGFVGTRDDEAVDQTTREAHPDSGTGHRVLRQ